MPVLGIFVPFALIGLFAVLIGTRFTTRALLLSLDEQADIIAIEKINKAIWAKLRNFIKDSIVPPLLHNLPIANFRPAFRTQFELIGMIVRIALYIIIGVGAITTGLFVFAMVNGYDTKIVESAWSNMFGILLTNSFSIIGTIMGVKYATDNKKQTDK